MTDAALPSDQSRPPTVSVDDQAVIIALRRGDEAMFMRLVEQLHPAMLRLATVYVANRAVAEEVVQEAWIGVLRGLDGFEGRSSLKTWIFRILTNRAKTRAERERRVVAFSAMWSFESEPDEPSVEPDRFFPADHKWAAHWSSAPASWHHVPEERLLSQETHGYIRQAIDQLPASQRAVIAMRDIDGLSAEEVCNILAISESNQRVLLHRARSKVRRALEQYLSEEAK